MDAPTGSDRSDMFGPKIHKIGICSLSEIEFALQYRCLPVCGNYINSNVVFTEDLALRVMSSSYPFLKIAAKL